MRRGRGRAIDQFLEGLQQGDPIALGLAGFVVLLAVVAGAIWLADRKNQREEKAKGTSRPRNGPGLKR